MPRLQNLPLTKIDFDNASWQNLISHTNEKECENYSRQFFQEATEAQARSDAVNEEVFTLLGAVCSMWLRPDTGEVFHPLFVFYDPPMRGFMLSDLSDEHLALLADVATDTSDPEMRARLADVVWVKGRSKFYRLVEIAVRAYLESAKRMLSSADQTGLRAILRLERALSLAHLVRNRSLSQFALDEVESIILSHDKSDQSFSFASMLRLLLDYHPSNPSTLSALSEDLANSSESQAQWMDAQVYWQLKADWDIRLGNKDDQREALIRVAEAHVKVGELYAGIETPNYAAACFQLERALEIYRNIGGMREKSEEIHKRILKYQQEAVNDFQHVSVPFDVTEAVQKARHWVKEQPLHLAILRLAFAARPTNHQRLREQVEVFLADTSFHMLFSLSMTDHEGHHTANSPSLLNAGEDDKELVLRARICMEATRHQKLVAAAIIEPMLHQISLDHYIQMNDLAFLVRHNGFIPFDRAFIYLKGLHAGFQGDYLVASHLLIPQIESSLRYVLNQHGLITSSLNIQTGIQENFTLDTVLGMPELEGILGTDMVFDLQCLLVRRFGSNLRNRLSHGLMHSREFSSEIAMYFWWLVLYLCCHGLSPAYKDTQEKEDID
jgi:hypothetical protein